MKWAGERNESISPSRCEMLMEGTRRRAGATVLSSAHGNEEDIESVMNTPRPRGRPHVPWRTRCISLLRLGALVVVCCGMVWCVMWWFGLGLGLGLGLGGKEVVHRVRRHDLYAAGAAEAGDLKYFVNFAGETDLDSVDDRGVTPLLMAVRNNHRDLVDYLLEHDASANKGGVEGWTPLHEAAHLGLISLVQKLLSVGAQCNVELVTGSTPLHIAVEAGDMSVVELLVRESSCDPNLPRNDGSTALHIAAQKGTVDVVRAIVEHSGFLDAGDRKIDLNTKTTNKSLTPLHVAVINGREAVVNYLISQGADRHATGADGSGVVLFAAQNGHGRLCRELVTRWNASPLEARHDGSTALFFAVQQGDIETVEFLLTHGAKDHVNKASNGTTPLHVAAARGREDMVSLLLAHEADVSAEDHERFTPLHLACASGHRTIASTLLGKGGHAMLRHMATNGWFPIHAALNEGHTDVVEYLLSVDGDVVKQPDGVSLLHLAVASKDLFSLRRILGLGADPFVQAPNGQSLLHASARIGVVPMLRDLLDARLDPNLRDKDGATALLLAVEGEFTEAVELLVQQSDVNTARTTDGYAALHVASSSNNVNLAQILLDKGADVNQLDHGKSKRTPLAIAAKEGYEEMFNFLESRGGTGADRDTMALNKRIHEITSVRVVRRDDNPRIVKTIEPVEGVPRTRKWTQYS